MKNLSSITLICLFVSGLLFVYLHGGTSGRFKRVISYLTIISLSGFSFFVSSFSDVIFEQFLLCFSYSIIIFASISVFFRDPKSVFQIASISSLLPLIFSPAVEGLGAFSLINFPDYLFWGDRYRVASAITASNIIYLCIIFYIKKLILNYFTVADKNITHCHELLILPSDYKTQFKTIFSLHVLSMLCYNFNGYSHFGIIYCHGLAVYMVGSIIVLFVIINRNNAVRMGLMKLMSINLSFLLLYVLLATQADFSLRHAIFPYYMGHICILLSIVLFLKLVYKDFRVRAHNQ